MQVETEGQMAYLHHRLNQCPHENMLLEKARQTGKHAGRPAAHTAPHKVMPLQVSLHCDVLFLHHTGVSTGSTSSTSLYDYLSCMHLLRYTGIHIWPICVVCYVQVAMVTDSRTLHHYWSHTDVSPWSADGSLMLSQRADVSGMRDLLEGTRTRLHQDIGFTNFTTGAALISVAVSTCFDLQHV